MTHPRSAGLRPPVVKFEPMTPTSARLLGPAFSRIDPWARYAYSPEALTTFLAAVEPGAPRFAIVVERAVAGAIGVRRNWLRGPYLQFLGILPPFQRQGIGRSALAWFEGEARAVEAQNLWVAASDFNARALAFYERHGFSRVATLEDLVVEGGAETLLRKRLAPMS